MRSSRPIAFAITTMFMVPATAKAQATLDVTEQTLVAGADATLVFKDTSRAGQTILVEIEDGGLVDPQHATVSIRLDANGYGTATWSVPSSGWTVAHFNAPGAQQITRQVTKP